MKLSGKKVVVLLAEGFEDLEYWVTVMRLREEGAEVVTVGPDLETIYGKNALSARADATAGDVDASGLDGIVIPGGWAPDKLRRYPKITEMVRDVHERRQGRRHHLSRGTRSHLGWYRGRRSGYRVARHQGRPGKRRRHLGRRARFPGRELRLGEGRAGHTGVLPRVGLRAR